MTKDELNNVMRSLSLRRPVFHSEADFQHELAIELVKNGYQVRLEVPREITINGTLVRAEIDLLIHDGKIWIAIELKYVKTESTIEHCGEVFQLKETWLSNLSRFDCFADCQRIEAFVDACYANVGYSVFLTNKADAWEKDISNKNNLARSFSIHEGRIILSNTPLNWYPNDPTEGSVSSKRLPPYSPITLIRERTIEWFDYSYFESVHQKFKYLIL